MTLPKRPKRYKNSIESSVKKATKWIFGMKASDGAFLLTAKDPSSSGAWPTSQAICAILASKSIFSIKRVRGSLLWLQNRQKDGFWGPMKEGFQFNDSTVWTLLAFNLAHVITKEYELLLTESVSELSKNINDDGGWGSWKDDKSRVVITSLILFLFNKFQNGKESDITSSARNRAVNFLLDCQNLDGGWGFSPAYGSNPIATSYALIALSQQKEHAEAQIIDGIQWLEEEKRKLFSDNYELFKHESVWRANAIQRWSYFSLPLIAYALVINGHSYSAYKVIRKLIFEQRPDGSWIDPDEQYLNFHTYTTSFFLNQINKLLDHSHFERYLKTIEEINKDEIKSVLSANRSRLKRIIIDDAFNYSDTGFKLSSGETSKFFYDLKPVILNPLSITIIGRIIWEMIKNESVNAVGGPETGAIPIAMSVVQESISQGGELKAFYVRKEPKKHGTKRWIEGNLSRNDRIILVEDVVTTGGSVLKAIDKLVEQDCIIEKVICIIDREQGGEEKIKSREIEFISIFKHSDFKELQGGNMVLNKHGIQFMIDVKENLNTVNNIEDFCHKKKLSKVEDDQIRILASCLLGVLYEISSYLNYFEEDIEKPFGLSTEEEWNNIKSEVILKSIDNVINNVVPTIMNIVDTVNYGWSAYDKKNAKEMLGES